MFDFLFLTGGIVIFSLFGDVLVSVEALAEALVFDDELDEATSRDDL